MARIRKRDVACVAWAMRLCWEGRHFWQAAHDHQRGVRLEYWYVEGDPFCTDMARHFDVRNLPGYDAAQVPKAPLGSGMAEFRAWMEAEQAYHASVIRACLDSGEDPLLVHVAVQGRKRVAEEAQRAAQVGAQDNG